MPRTIFLPLSGDDMPSGNVGDLPLASVEKRAGSVPGFRRRTRGRFFVNGR